MAHEKRLTSSKDVLVFEENTLGGASGAGSVHDTAEILGLRRYRLDHVLLTLLGELVEALDGEMGVSALELVNIFLLDVLLAVVDNVLDILDLVQGLDQLGEEVGVEEDEFGVSLLERVFEAFLAESVVGGDDGHGLGGGG
jgi:hypothetical protein